MGRRILSRGRPGCKSRPRCPRPPTLPTLLGRAASPSNSDGTASTSVRGGGRARAYGRRAAPVATVPTGHSDGRSESSESESFSPAPLLVFTSVCSSACQADGSRRPRRRAMAPASLRGSQEEAAPLRARKHRPRPGSRSPRRCAVGPLRGSREEASPLRRRRPRAVGPLRPCARGGRRPHRFAGGGRAEKVVARWQKRSRGQRAPWRWWKQAPGGRAGAQTASCCGPLRGRGGLHGEESRRVPGERAGEQTVPRAVGPGSSVRERRPVWRGGRTPTRGEGRGERLIDTRPSFCVNSGGRSKRGQVLINLI